MITQAGSVALVTSITLKLSNKQIILDEYFKKIEEIKTKDYKTIVNILNNTLKEEQPSE